MPYSESLAERVRQVLRQRADITEKRMFGGLACLMSGNMLVGVWQQSLIVRLGPAMAAEALQQPFVRPFDGGGKPMKGWVVVGPEGVDLDAELKRWIEQAEDFVQTLPRKDAG